MSYFWQSVYTNAGIVETYVKAGKSAWGTKDDDKSPWGTKNYSKSP